LSIKHPAVQGLIYATKSKVDQLVDQRFADFFCLGVEMAFELKCVANKSKVVGLKGIIRTKS